LTIVEFRFCNATFRRVSNLKTQSSIDNQQSTASAWKLDVTQIQAPQGYLASAAAAGIKKEGRLDVGLLYSIRPSIAAARFTTNAVKAAPVKLSQRHLEESGGEIRAIIVNSGNANACTGEDGLAVAKSMADLAGRIVAIPPGQVLVCSTGVIGVPLSFEKIERSSGELKANLGTQGIDSVSKAILTTDTVAKICTADKSFGKSSVRISGMTKGAGMIHPRMATTLAFVLTDAFITKSLLDEALTAACEKSYHRITVDGDTSTNDTLVVIANGASGASVIEHKDGSYQDFLEGLTQVCQSLAQQIIRDGEGASKFVEIVVQGSDSEESAAQIGRSIANSPLVKTALAGEDANWGRILCAAGYSGVPFDPDRVEIKIGDLVVCKRGTGTSFSEAQAKQILGQRDIRIGLNLHAGSSSATLWTCDLTKEYIHINADYRT
jgi:glutamate N-acetyltransferase/amino-acid N-acetyltransferase